MPYAQMLVCSLGDLVDPSAPRLLRIMHTHNPTHNLPRPFPPTPLPHTHAHTHTNTHTHTHIRQALPRDANLALGEVLHHDGAGDAHDDDQYGAVAVVERRSEVNQPRRSGAS